MGMVVALDSLDLAVSLPTASEGDVEGPLDTDVRIPVQDGYEPKVLHC